MLLSVASGVPQKVPVGGARPLEPSTQLSKPTVPEPVVEVMETLLSYTSPGGVVGAVKPWDANQMSRVTASVVVMNSDEPNCCARPGVPGELELAERTSTVAPGTEREQVIGPELTALVAHTVAATGVGEISE